jgi:imidazole glycerol-phosphate synthase subunit HisH
MVTIVDYKTGNLGSIRNILKRIGEDSLVTSSPADLIDAKKIILPGVGAFDTGMKNLRELGLIDILNEKVLQQKVPVLGICLGMQLLSTGSEEGMLAGLGWLKAITVRFNFRDTGEYKIPHMGWNYTKLNKPGRLFTDMYPEPRFYFVHSFYLKPDDAADVLTYTTYETEFASSVESGNILGVQFHPEKSHKFGMQLLRNFVTLY